MSARIIPFLTTTLLSRITMLQQWTQSRSNEPLVSVLKKVIDYTLIELSCPNDTVSSQSASFKPNTLSRFWACSKGQSIQCCIVLSKAWRIPFSARCAQTCVYHAVRTAVIATA